MAIICGIDYGDLDIYKRHEIDRQAYAKYYDDYFEGAKSFNSWYGTKSHVKYISTILPQKTKLVRKLKLEKIEKLKEMMNENND